MIETIKARPEHLTEIIDLIEQCITALEAEGVFQWDERYPDEQFFRNAIGRREAHVLLEEGAVRGVVVLDEKQSPEWDAVVWQNKGKTLVVHALAIRPGCQGRGYGGKLLRYCESLARQQGYGVIRLDAFSENGDALRFYERRGYRDRGCVRFACKPEGHQEYICYEKQTGEDM